MDSSMQTETRTVPGLWHDIRKKAFIGTSRSFKPTEPLYIRISNHHNFDKKAFPGKEMPFCSLAYRKQFTTIIRKISFLTTNTCTYTSHVLDYIQQNIVSEKQKQQPEKRLSENIVIIEMLHNIFHPAVKDIAKLIDSVHFHIFIMS